MRYDSSKLNVNYVVEYGNFEKIRKDRVVGFKLVRKSHGNYYSIATGSYRYKIGHLDKMSNYPRLYKKTKTYKEEMVGKIAIFQYIEDIEKIYGKVHPDDFVILKIMLVGNIMSASVNNKVLAYAGENIATIEEVDK